MAGRSSIVRKILIGLFIVFIVIQFVRPAKNADASVTEKDITMLYPVSDSVRTILKKACYDCHSNYTAYPWYFNIQPVGWWMNDHIDEGKDELNFSTFADRKLKSRARKLKKLAKEVEEGEMPLPSYTWIHKEAILSEQEKKTLIAWATNLSEQISAQLPPEERANPK